MTMSRIAMFMVLGASTGCLDSGDVQSVDAAASQLAIEPTIVDADAAPPDGMIPVVVQFFKDNQYVKLTSGALSINGVAVPYGSQGYVAKIPIVPSGGTITFMYTRAGTVTQFPYRVPPRPTITTPAPNDSVTRTVNLMIAYPSSTGQAVRPLASDASLGAMGIEQTDNGMAVLDVTGLRPGPGSVGLARRYVTPQSGTGFQSVAVTYTITSLPTPVTWQ
jgi:hypothetical protein